MNPNDLRDILLEFPAVTEEQPFGPEVVVYKVMGKCMRSPHTRLLSL